MSDLLKAEVQRILALPEPIECSISEDGDCTNGDFDICTCKFYCGESSDAGCCYCVHTDIYEPCPRGGSWCDPCGDSDACCTPEQQLFAKAAHIAWERSRAERLVRRTETTDA